MRTVLQTITHRDGQNFQVMLTFQSRFTFAITGGTAHMANSRIITNITDINNS